MTCTTRCIRDIEYQLLPSRSRRTTDIVIERDGIVTVRSPIGHTPEQVDAVVESKRLWIYRNLAEWKALNASAVIREWVNGETFLYLGRAYRRALVTDQDCALQLKEGRFHLNSKVLEKGGTSAAKRAFAAYYISKGRDRLSDRIQHFSPKVGVQVTGHTVKDLGYHWASCGKQDHLNFHWKCMMAPLKIIDYIVVHELCHLHHRNHSAAFWNEVDKVMPDYSERKVWLKEQGASLTI